MNWVVRESIVFLLALQFLTRLPLPQNVGYSPERFAATPRYFPLVGAVVGGIGAVAYWITDSVFPAMIAVLMSMAATILATGAFHEDGLADMADGVGGGTTRERVLEIMKDSRLGSYGTCALVGSLAFKAAALLSMPGDILPIVLVTSHVLSRWSSVIAVATGRYVRDAGMAKPVAMGVSMAGVCIATATAVVCAAMFGFGLAWQALCSGLVGLLFGHACARLSYERKLGGYTGDCLGGVQQLSEIGFCLGVVAWLSF